MREFKHHEQKLLKRTDFLNWKKERNSHELQVVRRYHLQDREDYTRYSDQRLSYNFLDTASSAVSLLSLSVSLSNLNPMTCSASRSLNNFLKNCLFSKLQGYLLCYRHRMGIISNKKSLELCEKIAVSAVCRYGVIWKSS